MTGLLVSVRNAAEAEIALAAGVDVLDVKEPAHGSLGAAKPDVVTHIASIAQGRSPVSVALGELRDLDPLAEHDLSAHITYAKLGLAGCSHNANWPEQWAQILATWPGSVTPVAVAYADWQTAAAPPPQDVVQEGWRLGCKAALVDTYDKRLGGLFDLWEDHELGSFIAWARSHGMLAVVAGSLTLESLPRALQNEPDLIAVRGAVCRAGRSSRLDPQRVAQIARRVKQGGAWPGDSRTGR